MLHKAFIVENGKKTQQQETTCTHIIYLKLIIFI